MRKKIIIGNWKMNNTLSESISFIQALKKNLENILQVDIAVCPSYISLNSVKEELSSSNIKVGAQNVYFEDKGAYTGEISAEMLKDIDIDYCIIGHSERRQYFKETDYDVNKKLIKLLEYEITPVVCVGENISQRESNTHFSIVKEQIVQALNNINSKHISSIVIAYEPIWAIGTGITATAEQAEEMCNYIRNVVSSLYNKEIADSIRIQYGGSVNSNNAREILMMPNIDGALVGGASLKEEFIDIVNSAI